MSSTISVSPDRQTAPAELVVTATQPAGLRFSDVLSMLNPLQYMPVVGTIYRAVTGDTVPEAARLCGSMLVSGLMGGPIGLLTNIATTLAEKVTGIDPERIAHSVMAHLGLASSADAVAPAASPAVAAAAPAAATAAPKAANAPAGAATGWSNAALTADGVQFGADGVPSVHGLSGAEALNDVELGRVRMAVAAYARTAGLRT
ncbi:MAG TPA: hypothetical protein VIZ17_12720 [Acetobacteraceae bacterium]